MAEFETQISAKYSPENLPVYALKQKLENTGLGVRFPKGNSVTSFKEDFAITHPDETLKPFYTTEVEFLRSVKENPVHIVCNVYQNESGKVQEGYIGESASIEVAYALTQNKPIVMVRPPVYSAAVPEDIKEIITSHQDKIHLLRIDTLPDSEVVSKLEKIIDMKVDYQLTDTQCSQIMQRIVSLARGYRSSWNNYQSNEHQ